MIDLEPKDTLPKALLDLMPKPVGAPDDVENITLMTTSLASETDDNTLHGGETQSDGLGTNHRKQGEEDSKANGTDPTAIISEVLSGKERLQIVV